MVTLIIDAGQDNQWTASRKKKPKQESASRKKIPKQEAWVQKLRKNNLSQQLFQIRI